jgi:hypothetical protein
MQSWMRDLWRASMRPSGIRAASVLVVLVGTLALAGSGGIASADNGGPGTAIGYGSTYDALVAPETPPGATWNSDPGFDTTGWTLGAPAPFGQGECAQNSGDRSGFPLGSTIYLRKSFTLPANAFDLHVAGSIDNYADIWVNGTHEGGSPISDGNCHSGGIDVDVPNGPLDHGGSNLIAVRAQDDDTGSTFFDMQATYGAIQFANQPAETQKASPITDGSANPVEVTITPPAEGGPIPDGTEVDLTLQTISGSGTLSGGTASTTDGVATFPNLEVSAPGEYRLVATSEGATVTSDAFVIADQVTTCTGSCSADGSTPDTSIQASTSSNGGALAVSVIDGAGVPSNVCGGNFTQLGAGAYVDLLGSAHGNLLVSWTLDRSLVGRRSALSFDLCLGADNLLDPSGSSTTGWTTKNGTPATRVPDSNLGVTLFWGLLRQCFFVPWSHGLPTSPCWIDKRKNLRGDVIIDAFVPYPWDASFHGG